MNVTRLFVAGIRQVSLWIVRIMSVIDVVCDCEVVFRANPHRVATHFDPLSLIYWHYPSNPPLIHSLVPGIWRITVPQSVDPSNSWRKGVSEFCFAPRKVPSLETTTKKEKNNKKNKENQNDLLCNWAAQCAGNSVHCFHLNCLLLLHCAACSRL